MINVAVTGAAGRMGTAIIGVVQSNPLVKLVAALERDDSPALGHDSGEIAGIEKTGVKIIADREKAFKKADCIIDFTTPDSSMKTLEEAAAMNRAMVVGTTGFSLHQRDTIKELGRNARIVAAPNMSVGVNLLLKIVAEVARATRGEYDVEIVEAHHSHKKDAPSGTAVRIAEVIAATLGRDLDSVAVYQRKGIIGERRPEEIGIQSIRAGDIVGDHTVMFAGAGERIELIHKASSREAFAIGAVRAAIWVLDRPNGLYDMQDVLGLKSQEK